MVNKTRMALAVIWLTVLAGTAFAESSLATARSPYMRLHANHPIQWREWGEAAFEDARELDRPIFLSIGYLTCRGCQVLKEETFSQPAVVAFLNDHFIPILVDREERPDVDRIYQAFVAGTTGRGGWPLNVWMTPDLEPYLGGTYFPPHDRPGMPSLLSTARLADRGWREDRDQVTARAQSLRAALETMATMGAATGATYGPAEWRQAAHQFLSEHDPVYGGFGTDMKFPHAAKIHFLLYFSTFYPEETDMRDAARTVALNALSAAVSSPLRDTRRGGFHRYTTDRAWQHPHFEMMLYDQASLLDVLLDAYLITNDIQWVDSINGVAEFVGNDLTLADGSFASSFNAINTMEDGVPLLDEKQVTAWNGYMIAALARAAMVMERSDWLVAAVRAARQLETLSMDSNAGLLRLGEGVPGFAEDYASVIHAWLTLFEATFDLHWLQQAEVLQEQLDIHFGDPGGGYFSTRPDAADVLVRMKEDFDGAEPSANSLAARNLRRLFSLTGRSMYRDRADELFRHFAGHPFNPPSAMPVLLAESLVASQPAIQIVIAGDPEAADTQTMLRHIRQRFLPGVVVILADPADSGPGHRPAYIEGMVPLDGLATAYVCEDFVCRLPVTDPEQLARMLDEMTSELHKRTDEAPAEPGTDNR